MLGTMRRYAAMLIAASGLALLAAVPAFGQVTTGTVPGGSETATGPNAPLTLGTTASGTFTGGGGDESAFEEEPLPHTGGGDVAFAAGSLLLAGGLGLHWVAAHKR